MLGLRLLSPIWSFYFSPNRINCYNMLFVCSPLLKNVLNQSTDITVGLKYSAIALLALNRLHYAES